MAREVDRKYGLGLAGIRQEVVTIQPTYITVKVRVDVPLVGGLQGGGRRESAEPDGDGEGQTVSIQGEQGGPSRDRARNGVYTLRVESNGGVRGRPARRGTCGRRMRKLLSNVM